MRRSRLDLVSLLLVTVLAPAAAGERPRSVAGATAPATAAASETTRPQPPPGARYAVPLWGGGKHLIVRGTFNDRLSGPLLIDTGASYCVLTHAVARELGLADKATDAVPVATANGHVLADLVHLDSVQIERARLGRVEAVVMDAVDPPLIGIIGLSFLSHFRYSVDHAEGTIQLER